MCISTSITSTELHMGYHIARKLGELTLFEHLARGKFGELIDQPIGY